MSQLLIFRYKSDIVPDFNVFAPLKHGTRFLDTRNPIQKKHITTVNGAEKFQDEITNELFDFIDNPKSTKTIQLKKLKVLKKENSYFIYRNPYDAFISAIQTGYASSKNHRNVENLDANMTGNGHFYTHYYRILESVLQDVDGDTISFVELSDLTKFFRIETLESIEFSKSKYSFDTYITKEELEILCKTHHPILWHRFMLEIDKETIALNNLIKKFDWKIKINKEMMDMQNIKP